MAAMHVDIPVTSVVIQALVTAGLDLDLPAVKVELLVAATMAIVHVDVVVAIVDTF